MRRLSLCLVLAIVSIPTRAIEPFFAPAVPQGEVEVRLHPTEVVSVGVPVLVSFGMPFPRGSITAAGLASVRVLRDGVEIPAHVSEMTPWRHRSNAAIDAQSVRVALIQVSHSFGASFPASEPITVAWGGASRALDVPMALDVRAAWHQVAAGGFSAQDNVFEPDVYAVLPHDWLSRGLLTSMRATPFDPSNDDARDDPATIDAIAHWPGTQEAERAHKNNFFTVINQDPGSASAPNPYLTQAEPWLYDRAATMFRLYFRSGSFAALRQAVRNTQFYAGRQNANGFFAFGGVDADSKYAYNECLAYVLWTTGDPQMPARIARTPIAQSTFAHAWTPARGFWTERHAAFKLLANVVAYEVAGGASLRDAVDQILGDYRAHQDGANGGVPTPYVDGGLYHTGSQHAGDWGSSDYGGSSWMSALLTEAAVRAYATGEDAATAAFIARLGDFMRATVVTTVEHSYSTSDALALPRYAMLRDGSDGQRNFEDVEHALDVAGQIAWAHWFRESLAGDGTSLRAAAVDLYETYDEGVNFWIRPTAPPANTAYRVSPPRKWAWEHRTSDGLAFALIEADPDDLFDDGFEPP
jgi:hypothetical protein